MKKRIFLSALLFLVACFVFAQHQKDFLIDVGAAQIGVTLSTPQKFNKKKGNILLIIPGSGNPDRNGNQPGMVNASYLKMLSDSLVAKGIATLRFDKRYVGKSIMKRPFKEDELTIDTLENDVLMLYKWLSKSGFKKVYLAGHSEGALIALLMAQEINPAGIISISGAGRRGDLLLSEQLRKQIPQQAEGFIKQIDSINNGYTVQNNFLFRKSVQPYLKSYFDKNPTTLIKNIKAPILIIQGLRDIQVTKTDAVLLHEANPKSILDFMPNMTHVLKDIDTDSLEINQATYTNPSYPISMDLVNSIVKFVNSKK